MVLRCGLLEARYVIGDALVVGVNGLVGRIVELGLISVDTYLVMGPTGYLLLYYETFKPP